MKSFSVGAAAALVTAWALPTPDTPQIGRFGEPLAPSGPSPTGFLDVEVEAGIVTALFEARTTSLADADGRSLD